MRGPGFLQLPAERPSLLALGAGSRHNGWSRGGSGAPASRAALTWAVQLLVLAAVVLSPWLHIPRLNTSLLTLICIYGIAATGLNLMFGYGGMLSLGNGVFLGVSAYGSAILSQKAHWAMVPAMLVGIAAGTAAAALLGVLLVRLSAHYFGVATLGLAIAFFALPDALPNLTGGGSGITTKPQMSLGFVTVQSKLGWYVVALVVTAAVVAILAWAVAGKRGRILRLVRHDQLAAEVLGVPVLRVKLLAFVLGAGLAAVAGALLFASQGLVDPASASVLTSVQLAMLVVIGGPGYRLGGLVGAFVVLWLQALLNSSGSYELVVYGAVLLAVVFFLRAGLEGSVADLWSSLAGRWGRAADEGEPAGVLAPAGAGTAAAGSPAGAAAYSRDGSGRPGGVPAVRGVSEGLEVRSARRSFGGVVAVDGVSIVAPAGKVTALVGANGAGKSTLLNLISGVEPLEAGSVTVDGEDITRASPAERTRRGIVRTFQVPRLVDELPVVQNVVLGREAAEHSTVRRRRSVERAELARARETLSELSLQHLADRPARSLGTGERKYAELARAMFADASVILLDEPAVGLSVEEVGRLRGWLAQLRDNRAAVVVIDHNIDFIRELADHVYSMESGRIVWEGAPGDLAVETIRPRRPAGDLTG